MMEKWINHLVENMIKEQIIKETEKENYIYTITCLTESVVVIGSILLISFFLKNMISTVGFLIFFFSLRKRTGGYHAKTFLRCYITTLITYGLVVFFCQKVSLYNQIHWLLLMLAGMAIVIIGSVNHPNMHWDKNEFLEMKKAARWMFLLELCIVIFLKYLKIDTILISYLSTAIILCGILLLVAKILRQEVKSNGEE